MLHCLFPSDHVGLFMQDDQPFTGVAYMWHGDHMVKWHIHEGRKGEPYVNPLFRHIPEGPAVDTTCFLNENDMWATPYLIDGKEYQGFGYSFEDGHCTGEVYFEDDGFVSDWVFRDRIGGLSGTLFVDDYQFEFEVLPCGTVTKYSVDRKHKTLFHLELNEQHQITSLFICTNLKALLEKQGDRVPFPEVCSLEYVLKFQFADTIMLSGSWVDDLLREDVLEKLGIENVKTLNIWKLETGIDHLLKLLQYNPEKVVFTDDSFDKTEVLAGLSAQNSRVAVEFQKQ